LLKKVYNSFDLLENVTIAHILIVFKGGYR
jgi:hypothetical protein